MRELNAIIELSHEFGGSDYVKGGGGNTSTKNAETLWVKPSGTTLAGLTPENMVAMDRSKVAALYHADMPADADAREARVKELMEAAVENDAGRPSVEAPLHNVFHARYVVHTHPALVNGLTCARDGQAACGELFPDALWIEYIDPGYTLCMEVRDRIEDHRSRTGDEPRILMLQNHGVFVAADTPEDIRTIYRNIMNVLDSEYRRAGISAALAGGGAAKDAATESEIADILDGENLHIASSGDFEPADGPLTPDHLVYARAFPFTGELNAAEIGKYIDRHGYPPKVIRAGGRVYGVGNTPRNAELALEFARDAALVVRLAEAFGGVSFMTDAQRKFIENWEVESYRARQSS